MKNYQCQICGEGILLEPRDAAKYGAYCTEHLFSQRFPALDQLADQAAEEEQRDASRQEDRRAAETNNQKEEVAMSDSIARIYEPTVSNALTEFLTLGGKYRVGFLLWECSRRNIGEFDRIHSLLTHQTAAPWGDVTWHEEDLPKLADLQFTTPGRLVAVAEYVAANPEGWSIDRALDIVWDLGPETEDLVAAMSRVSGQPIYTLPDMLTAAADMGIQPTELVQQAEDRIGGDAA